MSADQIYSGDSLIRALIANITSNLSANATEIESEPEKTGISWQSLILVIVMIFLSAYCNGTNIGVMGLDV